MACRRKRRGIRVLVPAKVNLFLQVGGKRTDGYHSIKTIFHTVGLWDEILIKPARSFSFRATGLPSPGGKANLCVKAYHLVKPLAPDGSPVSMSLNKRIPPGAGLGGGSADAAACLAGLDRIWRLGLSRKAVHLLAAQLGSDVPFFVQGGAALGTGRGEKLLSLPSRLNHAAVILKPSFGVSTRVAYARLDSSRGKRPLRAPSWKLAALAMHAGSPDLLIPSNDFEPVVCAMHPKLDLMLKRMRESGLSPAFMTGSGSAIVGVASSPKAARAAARRLKAEFRSWGSVVRLAPFRMKLLAAP